MRAFRTETGWAMDQLNSEPVAGMSESLAEGLVSRFVKEWNEADASARLGHPPVLTVKRAAGYRRGCQWLENVVPRRLRVLSTHYGDRTGKDKSALFVLVHWQPEDQLDGVFVVASRLDARRLKPEMGAMLFVTRHALVRLFQRLKANDDAQVLAEMHSAIKTLYTRSKLIVSILERPEALLPTPRGALVIDGDATGQASCVGKTWMSDERMNGNPARLRAVRSAREEEGFVLMVDGRFVVLSRARVGELGSADAVQRCINAQLSGKTQINQAAAEFAIRDAAWEALQATRGEGP